MGRKWHEKNGKELTLKTKICILKKQKIGPKLTLKIQQKETLVKKQTKNCQKLA